MLKTGVKQETNFYVDLLRQLPGLIAVCDKNATCIYSNDYTAKLFGYSSESSMIGDSIHEMKCPAVESAADFIKQNDFVCQTGTDLTILDIHQYSYGDPKILITKKTPYRDNGEIAGTIIHCVELHSSVFSKTCATLIKSDEKYYANKDSKERSYTVGVDMHRKKLSERELECVFYLLRCNTMKQIAKLLEISPRTVESYLEQVKIKLNCTSKNEIIEVCLAEGLLNYIPQKIQTKNISSILHAAD